MAGPYFTPTDLDTAETSGELALVGAILRQALKDARSRNADIRGAACAFLGEGGALDFYCHLLGMEASTVRARLQQAVRPG